MVAIIIPKMANMSILKKKTLTFPLESSVVWKTLDPKLVACGPWVGDFSCGLAEKIGININ